MSNKLDITYQCLLLAYLHLWQLFVKRNQILHEKKITGGYQRKTAKKTKLLPNLNILGSLPTIKDYLKIATSGALLQLQYLNFNHAILAINLQSKRKRRHLKSRSTFSVNDALSIRQNNTL